MPPRTKTRKLALLFSLALFFTGLVWTLALLGLSDIEPNAFPGLFILVGFGGYLVSRVLIWWHDT